MSRLDISCIDIIYRVERFVKKIFKIFVKRKGTLPNREDAKGKREGMLLSAGLSVTFFAEAHSHIAHVRDVQMPGLDKGGRRLAFGGTTDTAV